MAYFQMTLLALKWALRKPVTTQYPFELRVVIAGSRGQVSFSSNNCVYCNVCAKKCPTGAIQVNRTEERWSIDRFRCISCGYCLEVCPKKSLEFIPPYTPPAAAKTVEVF